MSAPLHQDRPVAVGDLVAMDNPWPVRRIMTLGGDMAESRGQALDHVAVRICLSRQRLRPNLRTNVQPSPPPLLAIEALHPTGYTRRA